MIEIFKKKNKKETVKVFKKSKKGNKNEIQKEEVNNLKTCPSDSINNINSIPLLQHIDKKHEINPNNLMGEVFGDYVVVDGSERDGSGHKLWACVCPTCGDTFKTTSYELIKGRKKTVCKKCEKARLDATSSSTVADPNVTYSTYNPLDVIYNPCTSQSPDATSTTSADIEKDADFTNMGVDGSLGEEIYVQICNKVFVRDLKEDLLDMPVYYNIAHCIPADLTAYGSTAHRINAVYDLVNLLKDDYMGGGSFPDVGDVDYMKNVFTLFATSKKYARPSMEDLRKCVANLAKECVDLSVMYLAMPRIGCGHNKLNWNEVRNMICEEFKKAYTNASNDTRVIRITFCYQ